MGELEGFALVSVQWKFLIWKRMVAVEIQRNGRGKGVFSFKITVGCKVI